MQNLRKSTTVQVISKQDQKKVKGGWDDPSSMVPYCDVIGLCVSSMDACNTHCNAFGSSCTLVGIFVCYGPGW